MLQAMQDLLAGIYDVPLEHGVDEFLMTDRGRLPTARGENAADEQVLVAEEGDTLWMSVYLEPGVLRRLETENPFEALHGGNIADTLIAFEGVSHFLRLAWSAVHGRPVTLLELELQGEIDKYVGSLWLLRRQNPCRFPAELHHVLFERARIDPKLAGERIGLYQRANAYAARFCRRLARGLRDGRWVAQTAAVAELRRFYRMSQQRKLGYIDATA
jgi:hypothetical protein